MTSVEGRKDEFTEKERRVASMNVSSGIAGVLRRMGKTIELAARAQTDFDVPRPQERTPVVPMTPESEAFPNKEFTKIAPGDVPLNHVESEEFLNAPPTDFNRGRQPS